MGRADSAWRLAVPRTGTVAATTSTLLTGAVAAGDTWTVELAAGGVTTSFSYVVAGGETLADIVAGLTAAINALTTDAYQAIAQGETLVVLDASGTVFTATYTLVPAAAGPTVVVATPGTSRDQVSWG